MARARIKVDNEVDIAFVWESLEIRMESLQLMAGLAFEHKPLERIFAWGANFAIDQQAEEQADADIRTSKRP